MVLGTRSAELVVVLHEFSSDGLGVLDDLSSVLLEGRGGSLLQSDSDTGDGLRPSKRKRVRSNSSDKRE